MNNKIHPDPNLQAKLEENKQMKIPIKLIQIQDTYNKANLERQYNFNLEIFEKQAALTREMQKEQAKLLKKLSWRTVIATILAVIIGALFGLCLECSGLKKLSQSKQEQVTMPTQNKNASVLPSRGEKETNKAIK